MTLTFEKVETEGNELHPPAVTYYLFANVDGVKVPLLSKSGGWVDQQVEAGKETQKAEKKS